MSDMILDFTYSPVNDATLYTAAKQAFVAMEQILESLGMTLVYRHVPDTWTTYLWQTATESEAYRSAIRTVAPSGLYPSYNGPICDWSGQGASTVSWAMASFWEITVGAMTYGIDMSMAPGPDGGYPQRSVFIQLYANGVLQNSAAGGLMQLYDGAGVLQTGGNAYAWYYSTYSQPNYITYCTRLRTVGAQHALVVSIYRGPSKILQNYAYLILAELIAEEEVPYTDNDYSSTVVETRLSRRRRRAAEEEPKSW